MHDVSVTVLCHGSRTADKRCRNAATWAHAHAFTNEAIPPAVQDMARRHLDALRGVITELVVAGQADGQVAAGEPDHLTLVYLSTLHGLAAVAAFIDEPAAGFPDAASVLRVFTPVGREGEYR